MNGRLTDRLGWVAVAAMAAVIAAAVPAACSEESAASDTATVVASAPEHVAQPPVKVAVLRFASADGKPFTSCSITVSPLKDAGAELGREIAAKLAAWPEYTILDAATVWKVVDKHRLARRGLDRQDVVRKLAKLTGADAVVIGETDGTTWSGNGHQGGSLYASFRMLSTTDAKVLWSIDAQVQDTESSCNLVSALATDATGRLFAKLQVAQGASLLAMAENHGAE